MNNNVINKIKELEIEENIWIVYLFIIFLSFYSNNLEKKYFLYNDINSKEKYQEIIIIIFTILLIIYFYFLYSSYKELKNIDHFNNKKNELTHLAFIAALLLTISGIIYLYIAIEDNNLDVELAFN